MTGLGQLRANGTAILRVRSLGYTGRDLDVAGTLLLSQKLTFEINEAAAGPVHLSFTRVVWCYSPAVNRGDRPVLEKWST